MARAKRKGLADYGLLAQRYVESFEQKWVVRDPMPHDELLGSADIQSLADLGNSYGLVRDMLSAAAAARTHDFVLRRTHHASHRRGVLSGAGRGGARQPLRTRPGWCSFEYAGGYDFAILAAHAGRADGPSALGPSRRRGID